LAAVLALDVALDVAPAAEDEDDDDDEHAAAPTVTVTTSSAHRRGDLIRTIESSRMSEGG
jgi:hypothetical protein